jgi:hypothetical protein
MKAIFTLTAALAASCLPVFLPAQTLQFGNLDVIQNNFNDLSSSISLSIGAGATSDMSVRASASNRGDYALSFGNASDLTSGVMISSVRQNGRDDSATGNSLSVPFFATSATATDASGYVLALFHASLGSEVNMNTSVAFFPFSQYLAGYATNTTNNGTLNTLVASTGIQLGSGKAFQTTSTGGQYLLNLLALDADSAHGILLVTGGKNEDNFALSRANADGTFYVFCKDNDANTTNYEADPVAFVYLPASGVGLNHLAALGRVNGNATTDIAGGSFSVTKGGKGQWYLSIPGHSESTGTLIVSPESGVEAAGGAGNTPDNIISAQWDATNSRWVVESRDITSSSVQPALQNAVDDDEDVFSFAFFTTLPINRPPTVILDAPLDGTAFIQGSGSLTLSATASDSDGMIAKVEFYDGSSLLGEDSTAPYAWTVATPQLGSHRYAARAIDAEGAITVSDSAEVGVRPPLGSGGMFFDGVNDHVTFGNNPALGLSSFTLELWFRREGPGVGASSGSGGITVEPLISKGRGENDGSNIDCNYLFGIESSTGKLAADFEDMATGLNHPIVGETVIPTGVWQHAAVTFDEATHEFRIYLNGGLEVVGSSNGQVPRSDSIQHAGLATAMNSMGVTAGAFFGFMDEVRIWDHARTQEEIQASINSQLTSGEGLVARFGMAEGEGTTLTSDVAPTITGNLVNGPFWIAGSPFDAKIKPQVAITAPAAGTEFMAPAGFTLTADATDIDGVIERVDFFRDGVLIGVDETAPYEISESGLVSGIYTYTAETIDNDDQVVGSAPVLVTVKLDPDHPPANTALRFDGLDDYVTMGVAPELGLGGPPSNGMTIECWFRREGAGITSGSGSGGVTGVPLFGKGRGEDDGSAIDCDYFFGIDSNGHLVADFETYPAPGLSTGMNYPVVGTNDPIEYGIWYHAAATYDGTTAKWKLYLNGVQVGSASAAAGALPRYDSIQHFGIATAFNSGGEAAGAFAGRIDEVRLWNYARTETQIANALHSEIASEAGLVGRYGLNEGGGTVVGNSVDVGGNPVGTVIGNPVWVEGAPFATSNESPTIVLDSPAPNATTMFPYPFVLAATAADADGSVVRVEFFVDGEKVGEDFTSPYSGTWTPTAVGTYSVIARAIDDLGGVTASDAVSIEVTANPNQPGVVTSLSPTNGATGAGENVTLQVQVSDPEGDGGTVTFYGRRTVPATPGPDFTLVTLPDTQYYSENTGGLRFQQFLDQTNWIVNNRDTLNIAFVSHMGDIVDDGDSIPQEWVNANQAMTQLENHATTLRAYGIPYGASPGNHDQATNGNPTSPSAYYNQYFGVSRYVGRPYWGGNYGDDNDNNYQLFSASGLDFLIIHLEYRTSADPAVIAWADALLKAYPSRRGIVTSHWIIGGGNPGSFGGQGRQIYDGLKNNPNLFMLLCGHIHAEGRRADVYEGRTIYTSLQDYQGSPDGGSGFLRYFTFSPANNQITAISYSPTLGRAPNAADAIPGFEGTYTIAYDMQSPVSNWIPLGTATLAEGGALASIELTGLEAGADYEWYAEVHDGINRAASEPSRFTTASASAPTITLTAPVNGLTYTAPANLTLNAAAADADGTVSRVDFFQGTVKLGADTTEPYTFATGQLAPGNYTFSAVAVDDKGEVKLSNLVSVTVADRVGMAPNVALTAPVGGSVAQVPGTIGLTASAEDYDGAVTKVAFYADGVLLGEDATAPFAWDWASALPGAHVLTAVATDNDGKTATSDQVTIQVAFTPEVSAVDTDGDLLGRLMEHALGLSENEPNRAGLPELGTASEGALTLTLHRAVSGLTYTVQASDNLEDWSDLSVNAGTVGADVTVTDTNTSSPNRYLRLKVSDGVSTQTTTPVGRLTHTLTTAREASMAFPMLVSVGTVTGHPAGVISSVGATTLDDEQAGWAAGAFSQPETPYIVRITSGAAAGRVLSVSTTQANTATRLNFTFAVDLTTLGIVAGTDTYEIVPADTLASLFPTGTLLSGTATTADLLRLWNGTALITYYHDGVNWRRQGAGIADNVVVRPDQAWMLARRGASRSFVTYGTVPSVAAAVDIAKSASNQFALLPLRRTFAQAALQNNLPGWASNSATPTAGDYVSVWNGTAWINYYYNGTTWRRQGAGDASSIVLFEPGRPVMIVRPTGSGRAVFKQTATY